MRKSGYLFVLLVLTAAFVFFRGFDPRRPADDIGRTDQKAVRAQQLNESGLEALKAGNPSEAAVLLHKAKLLEPDDAIIGHNLSIALAREANPMTDGSETAVSLLKESLQLWPRNPEALNALTKLHFRAGRYREALNYASILQQVMPDRPDLAFFVRNLQMRVAEEKGMSSERGDSFRLFYSDKKRLKYRGEILTTLQNQLDSLSTALGIFPDRTIDVLILTDDLGTRAEPVDPFLEGLYDGQIRLYVGEDIQDRQEFVRVVRHEMVHALLHQAAGDLPGWVQEGLAQKAGEEPGEEQITETRRYIASQIREGYRIDLSAVGHSFIELDQTARRRAYAASLVFMDYLTRKYGGEIIPRFVAELASGAPPEDALETLTGRTLADLQASLSVELQRIS